MGDEHEATHAPGGEDALLSLQIAQRLRTMIATDVLPPGTRLRERALAERLAVSRTPLREAVKVLAGDGLIVVLPKRGAVVADFDAADIAQKLEMLGVIEQFAGQQACQRATDADIAEIRATHHEMHAAYERRDRLRYFQLNQAIHRRLVLAARNASLEEIYERLNRQLFRYRYQGSVTSETWHTAIDEHDVIITLLSARDGERLGAFLRRHVHSTWERIAPEAAGEEEA